MLKRLPRSSTKNQPSAAMNYPTGLRHRVFNAGISRFIGENGTVQMRQINDDRDLWRTPGNSYFFARHLWDRKAESVFVFYLDAPARTLPPSASQYQIELGVLRREFPRGGADGAADEAGRVWRAALPDDQHNNLDLYHRHLAAACNAGKRKGLIAQMPTEPRNEKGRKSLSVFGYCVIAFADCFLAGKPISKCLPGTYESRTRTRACLSHLELA
jgi:hypothetical protein